ncbi:MAG: hydrogenase maturation protease [Pseudotabrizicola sp.]|uniref:hydrogenase maturation protease n=1 Tax=Pseudotabrizicola sp. TaxID=2939647 RepID=UPI002ACE360A|nr:hydrogenase maturation protease [Pseudotabrizicola sp.]MDZ7574097.1 hydrogenase maturation protease [Pseudotabrizicola sp.]
MVLQVVEDLIEPQIIVLGCGNPNRSDDGAGPAVIDLLRSRQFPPGVRFFDVGTDGMAVIYKARGATHLAIVDARVPMGTPGSVYEVPGEVLAAPPARGAGLHEFRWDNAIYAGQRIYGDAFPAFVTVFLIEAETLALGLSLSPKVATAVELVANKVTNLLQHWTST